MKSLEKKWKRGLAHLENPAADVKEDIEFMQDLYKFFT
jgi:hypothetical protein